ncbi:MAG TPA: hypothetical protein IAA18_02685, partial [Candidatus Pseudomonas excrementavium]|nr:hypothetical protein [Candidatus Pseudomonas excrementavium]
YGVELESVTVELMFDIGSKRGKPGRASVSAVKNMVAFTSAILWLPFETQQQPLICCLPCWYSFFE